MTNRISFAREEKNRGIFFKTYLIDFKHVIYSTRLILIVVLKLCVVFKEMVSLVDFNGKINIIY
jgi:hypothetical protein